MTRRPDDSEPPGNAEQAVQIIRNRRGPFVVAAESTRMPMLFTDARSTQNEIVYANRSFLDLTGYEHADAIGLPFHLLFTDAERFHAIPEAIAGADTGTLDLCCLRKDRTEFDASVLVSPVLDKKGKLQQYFVCVMDITNHIEKRVHGLLRQVEIYRDAPGFIAFTEGPEHHFIFANTAYETLVGRVDLVGRRVADALPELEDQEFLPLLDKVYQSGKHITGKKTPIRLMRGPEGEGETRYIDFIYQPVRDAEGAVVGLFCEGSDMTDVQSVSEKLNDIQNQLMHVARINAMGTMAATLAHELNQPLAAISNYASGCVSLVEQSGSPAERLQEGLKAIAAASGRAGDIIRSLRDMTKQTTPKYEVLDLAHALQESVHLVRVGGCENVSITTHCAEPIFVLGNRIQIQQVVINLVRNACQAAAQSNTRGEVVASVTWKNGCPSVVVRDNGPGIPAIMRDDVFKWTESTKTDGMGIGLSICRTIVEGHGGAITVDETGPSGTSFAFSLPDINSDWPTTQASSKLMNGS